MARSTSALIPRLLALLAQVVTFAGFVVIVAGLATIQRTTNQLGPPADIPADIADAYTQTYSHALVQPYPDRHGFQFAYIWFIIFFQFALLLFTMALTLIPGILHVGRAAALTLLAIACTLTITVVNNLVFFHKSETARTVYGARDIDVTLAGALLVAIGNGFTILTLGIGAPAVATTTVPATKHGEPAAVV